MGVPFISIVSDIVDEFIAWTNDMSRENTIHVAIVDSIRMSQGCNMLYRPVAGANCGLRLELSLLLSIFYHLNVMPVYCFASVKVVALCAKKNGMFLISLCYYSYRGRRDAFHLVVCWVVSFLTR